MPTVKIYFMENKIKIEGQALPNMPWEDRPSGCKSVMWRFSGNPIIDISQFVTNYNDSFSFEFVSINDLTKEEREIFKMTDDILNLIGGKPRIVKEIKISTTMRKDFFSEGETLGVWEPQSRSIIILRKLLNSIKDYAGTLIHEAIHAKSGLDDVDRRFEHELTMAIGQVSEKALEKNRKWWQ